MNKAMQELFDNLSEKDKQRMAFARERCERALHGMQSGVAMEIARGGGAATPKHLRVGVNSALVECGALATLLMRLGVIDPAEYLEALADASEAERAAYEERLTQAIGTKVTLV